MVTFEGTGEVTVNIELECIDCGNKLNAQFLGSTSYHEERIVVVPCEKCMAEAKVERRNDAETNHR